LTQGVFDTKLHPVTSGDSLLTEEQVRDGIAELAPFRHPIDLPYGLKTASREKDAIRVSRVMSHGWPALLDACGGSLDGLSVLDAACNSGGYSFAAARSGAKHVLGFDVVDRYIEQANFVKAALAQDFPGIEFRKLSVEDVSPDAVGTFDVTLCFGILYHFPDPVSAMEKLASVTGRVMFVRTMLYSPPSRWPRREVDQSVWRTNIRTPDSKETTANLWVDKPKYQFLPTPRAVIDLLRFLGFSQVTHLPAPVKGWFMAIR
jgi:2-polyprenyl-3-methyl-5-hydroxy-6-metoxy-1,4-benzoquinol methylase